MGSACAHLAILGPGVSETRDHDGSSLSLNVVERLDALRRERAQLRGTVGFVPTMGALHRGHASLLERARRECDSVVCSIFVNPTQFGPGEDFEAYPRTVEDDLSLCRGAGVDLVWTPQVSDIHLPGCETEVRVSGLGSRFEGASRPGHFQGVATVVAKLFGATSPHKAFFGQKDLQQLFLIRQMTRDLLMPIEIVGVTTARGDNGLALSSRNKYLTQEQREEAGAIYRGLKKVAQAFAEGERDVSRLEEVFRRELGTMQDAQVERFDLLEAGLARKFQEGESVESGFCSVAVRYAGVRLIDNIELCS
ncbi:MAG: pantoate--beta-alanine ligase [Candidatus Eremiobacteraeota bacterium]|nr:pantoate--beta-alanine ligase [Candidatus Eremiobacteraeota bacterium]